MFILSVECTHFYHVEIEMKLIESKIEIKQIELRQLRHSRADGGGIASLRGMTNCRKKEIELSAKNYERVSSFLNMLLMQPLKCFCFDTSV